MIMIPRSKIWQAFGKKASQKSQISVLPEYGLNDFFFCVQRTALATLV